MQFPLVCSFSIDPRFVHEQPRIFRLRLAQETSQTPLKMTAHDDVNF